MGTEEFLRIFERVASKKGWKVNPDQELVRSFAEGLIRNKERYGLAICPCRIATGKRETDRLIICPCAYAEEDIREYGRCYCGLPEIVVPDRHIEYLQEPKILPKITFDVQKSYICFIKIKRYEQNRRYDGH